MSCVNKQTNKQLIIDRLGTYANRMAADEEEDNAKAVAAVVGVAAVAGCCCRRRCAAAAVVVDVGAGHSHVVDDSVGRQ